MHNSASIVPRLWFSTDQRSTTYGQCDCDCDCACPASVGLGEGTVPLEGFLRQLRAGAILDVQMNPGTYLDCVGENTVALGTRGEHVVGMDLAASQLLASLSSPTTLQALRAELPSWPTTVFEETTAILLAMDIIASSQIERQPSSACKPRLAAWLHLTNQCNLACPYCYVVHDQHCMDAATAKRAVKAVYRSALIHGYRKVKLKYAGGEPTLNFDALLAAQRQAEELSARMDIELESGILTNGVQLSSRQIDALLSHNIGVMISLDGLGSYQDVQRPLTVSNHRSFERVSYSIDQLLKRGLPPHVSITITRLNISGLPSLVDYLLERGLRFSFNFYREPTRGQQNEDLQPENHELVEGLLKAIERIKRLLPKHSLLSGLVDRANLSTPHLRTCGVGENYLIIDCEGNVAKCQMDLDQPVTTIESHDPLASIREDRVQVQNLSVEEKECKSCVWRYRCSGGCPRLTYLQVGRYSARSPLCDVYQTIMPEVVRLEGLRLMQHEEPWSFAALN